jgi:hypothetical protein
LPSYAIANFFKLYNAVIWCINLISNVNYITELSVTEICAGTIITQTNSMALSPQANYTDWTTATCRRNLVPTFVDRGVSRGQRGGSPMAVKQ